MIEIILNILYILACFVLIMFVLLQPSKSDASGVFGGGANSTAFGPRGTQTVLAKVTITAAIVFFSIAFLFSLPGLFGKKSLGRGVGPAESQPAPVTPPATDQTAPGTSPPATPGTAGQPAAVDTNANKKAANANANAAGANAGAASGNAASGNTVKNQPANAPAATKNEPPKK